MSQAEKIVETLLETDATRVCAACQKERGQQGQPGESHGMCRRHFNQWYGSQFTPEEVASWPDEQFCPDMNQQQPQAA